MQCTKCNVSEMWDNRFNKQNPKQPDYKCKDQSCNHAIWLNTTKTPAPIKNNKGLDPAMMRLAYRKDLMVALIEKGQPGETVEDITNLFNKLWEIVEK